MSTKLEESERDLRRLVEKVAAKEKRIFNLSMVFTMLVVVGGIAWLWYAYDRVQKLNEEYVETLDKVKKLRSERDELEREKQLNQQSLKIYNNSPQIDKLIPRVYIQMENEDQREGARKIQVQLQNHGYLTPDIEKDSPNRDPTQLKYFHPSEKQEAEQVVNILQSLGVKIGPPVYEKGFENSTEMRPRHYDLWLGPDF